MKHLSVKTVLAIALMTVSAHVVANGATYHCEPTKFIIVNNHQVPFSINGHADQMLHSDESQRVITEDLAPKIVYNNNVCGRYKMSVGQGANARQYHLLVDYNGNSPANAVSINIKSNGSIEYNKQVVKLSNLDAYLAWHGPANIMQHKQLY